MPPIACPPLAPQTAPAGTPQVIDLKRIGRLDAMVAVAANPPLALLAEALREPLIPIIGFAELLTQEPLPPDAARRYGQEVLASSRQLLAVLDATLLLLGTKNRRRKIEDSETFAISEQIIQSYGVLMG
jgi:signal transduction histidine kinase